MAEPEFLCTQGSSQQTGNKNKLYFYMCEMPIAFLFLHTKKKYY